MGCGNYRALQWYAFWLNENYGLKISDIGEDSGCYDGNTSKVLKLCSPGLRRRGCALGEDGACRRIQAVRAPRLFRGAYRRAARVQKIIASI